MKYNVVNCTEEPDTAKKYGVKQAPTLLYGDERFGGAGAIIKWISDTAAVAK